MIAVIKKYVFILSSAVILLGALYAVSLLPTGERNHRPLETIQGIPYTLINSQTHVDEPLAHTDVYLNQPVFGQELVLTIEFFPTNIKNLAVGVRENEFWLSYPKYAIYESLHLQPTNDDPSYITSRLTIPLTDKLQEPDRSIDVMFFAEGDNPQWELAALKTEVRHTMPTWPEFKDYAKAIVKRERAL